MGENEISKNVTYRHTYTSPLYIYHHHHFFSDDEAAEKKLQSIKVPVSKKGCWKRWKGGGYSVKGIKMSVLEYQCSVKMGKKHSMACQY